MKFLTSLMITLMLATSLLAQTPSATEAQAKQELNAAAQAYRAGNFAEAQARSERALLLDPQNKIALMFVARTIHAQYRRGDSGRTARKARMDSGRTAPKARNMIAMGKRRAERGASPLDKKKIKRASTESAKYLFRSFRASGPLDFWSRNDAPRYARRCPWLSYSAPLALLTSTRLES